MPESVCYFTSTIVILNFQLLEPMLGGHLVFTVLGVPIHPITGSLIIIDHNLDWRGEVDEEILHGSCPIVAGTFFIIYKSATA